MFEKTQPLQTIKTGDREGSVTVIDVPRDLPFDVKRAYYIHSVKAGETRGFHAHKKLEQLLVCVHGSIKITLDDGARSAEVVLDHPSKGLLLSPGVWRTMTWLLDDSVLMCLASETYDEEDYIRNYDDFKKWIAG